MEIFTHWVTTQIPAMARPGLDQRWSLELSLSLLGARDLKDLSCRLLFPRLSISRKLELGMNSDPLWLLDACVCHLHLSFKKPGRGLGVWDSRWDVCLGVCTW